MSGVRALPTSQQLRFGKEVATGDPLLGSAPSRCCLLGERGRWDVCHSSEGMLTAAAHLACSSGKCFLWQFLLCPSPPHNKSSVRETTVILMGELKFKC